MTYHHFSYRDALAASERSNWRVEDLISDEKRLDFGRPFMPEQFVRARELSFLSPEERLVLNQIRGHGYLCIFGLVEEFILPFVLDHARPHLQSDDYRVRALLRFASEEAKHIHLFKRFREAFEAGFHEACEVVGPPEEVARAVLAHHPLAVALTILHIEWMTQRHYLDSVRDDQALDEQFKSLLRHHWIEEAQHAKLDTLMVHALAEACGAGEIEQAFAEYLQIGGMLDVALKQQTAFDMAALERATGRILSKAERERFLTQQHQAQRWTYLGSGMTHPNFLATLEQLSPEARARMETIAPTFC